MKRRATSGTVSPGRKHSQWIRTVRLQARQAATAAIGLRPHHSQVLILRPNADIYFTLPRRVEG